MISPLVLPVWQSFLSSASQDRGGDCIQSTKYTSQNIFLHAPSRSMKSRCSLAYPFQYCIIGSWKVVVYCVKGAREVYFIWQRVFMSLEKQFFLRHWACWFSELLSQEQPLVLSNCENPAMGISLLLSFLEKKGLTKSAETLILNLAAIFSYFSLQGFHSLPLSTLFISPISSLLSIRMFFPSSSYS